jgi:hypothetical protein
MSEFPESFRAEMSFNPELFRQKVNAAGRNMFPEWTEWNRVQAELLDEHCDELMKQLGYGCEWQWQKTAASSYGKTDRWGDG